MRPALLLAALLCCISALAQDIIVSNDGTAIKAYKLDTSAADYVYYTLAPDDSALQRIAKADILIIKFADGTKLDPNATAPAATPQAQAAPAVKNPHDHPAVTVAAEGSFTQDKKGRKMVWAPTADGSEKLLLRLISPDQKTLAIAKPDKKQAYKGEVYIIPEYVTVDGDTYTVTAIDDEAFVGGSKSAGMLGTMRYGGTISRVVFPTTLKSIGELAFNFQSPLEEIVLPEGLERIGNHAFYACGEKCRTFRQIYIPKGTQVGQFAFKNVGPDTSPRGYFQGNLTSCPDYITTGNCTNYGIDEEAIEEYREAK
ncbi:MAG: leucine-rich repeat domain-containing protein [Muribaculaceae bacterium]|nr:leucine-rich repeat domain-containing protein [Muribaculaceae bacterium]